MSYHGDKFEKLDAEAACPYCGGAQATCLDSGAKHPIWSEMTGVFIFCCGNCHSHFTRPLPTGEFLAFCYQNYAINGFPAAKSKAKPDSRQAQSYDKLLREFDLNSRTISRGLDIGAGEAHLTAKLLDRFPAAKLDAVDFSVPPQSEVIRRLIAAGRLNWIQADINRAQYGDAAGYDLITAIALIEHVKDPSALIQRMIALLRPGGKAYVMGPRAASPAQAIFQRKWVYHIPGEHLSVPSAAGIKLLMNGIGHQDYTFRPIASYYSTKYLVNALADKTWKWVPDVLLPIPSGTFLLEIRKPT